MMSAEKHNQTILEQLCPGDLVEFSRGIYSHWGVFVGNGLIAHLAGEDDDGINAKIKPEHAFTICGKTFNKARVCLDSFLKVAGETKAEINNNKDKSLTPLNPDTVVKNALSKVGEVGYSLMFKNCEHFAKWCRYGIEKSDQVDNFLTGAAVGVASAAALGLITAIARYWKGEEQEEEERKQKQ